MMVELSFIRDLIAIFGVIAGFSYYVLTVRNQQKNQQLVLKAQQQQLDTRQAQLFMQLIDKMWSPETNENRKILASMYHASVEEWFERYNSDTELYEAFNNYAYAWEGIGTLLRHP